MKKKIILFLICISFSAVFPHYAFASVTIKGILGTAKTNLNRYFRTTITQLQDNDYASSPNPVPVAYYKMDETGGSTIASSVGGSSCSQVLGSGGSISNGSTGVASNAIAITAGTARTYYNCGETADMSGATAMTVSIWVKRTSTSNGVLVGKESGSGNVGGYIFYISSNLVTFRVRNLVNTTTTFNMTTPTISSDGSSWTHIVGQWATPNTISVWINGVQYTPGSTPGSIASIGGTSGTNFTIGAAALGTPATSINGYIDDVRVYNSYLSGSDIANLYAYTGPQNVQVQTTATTTRSVKPAAPQNRKITSGLVGLWTFDGQDVSFATNRVTDRGSVGNNGNFKNMSTTTVPVPGRIGQAFLFDGVDDYVTGTMTSLPTGTSARSMGGWLNVTDTASVKVPFVYGSCSSTGDAFGVYLDASEDLHFWGCAAADFDTNTLVSTNVWHHVMATYDGTDVRVYLDGVQVGATTARTLTVGSSAWNVGSATGLDPANYYYKGKMDDIRIYNRAITAAEVASLYNLGH